MDMLQHSRRSIRPSLLTLAVASFAAFGAAGCHSDDSPDADGVTSADRDASSGLKNDAQDIAGERDRTRSNNRDGDLPEGPESDGNRSGN